MRYTPKTKAGITRISDRTMHGYKLCSVEGCERLIPRGDELCILHEYRETKAMYK